MRCTWCLPTAFIALGVTNALPIGWWGSQSFDGIQKDIIPHVNTPLDRRNVPNILNNKNIETARVPVIGGITAVKGNEREVPEYQPNPNDKSAAGKKIPVVIQDPMEQTNNKPAAGNPPVIVEDPKPPKSDFEKSGMTFLNWVDSVTLPKIEELVPEHAPKPNKCIKKIPVKLDTQPIGDSPKQCIKNTDFQGLDTIPKRPLGDRKDSHKSGGGSFLDSHSPGGGSVPDFHSPDYLTQESDKSKTPVVVVPCEGDRSQPTFTACNKDDKTKGVPQVNPSTIVKGRPVQENINALNQTKGVIVRNATMPTFTRANTTRLFEVVTHPSPTPIKNMKRSGADCNSWPTTPCFRTGSHPRCKSRWGAPTYSQHGAESYDGVEKRSFPPETSRFERHRIIGGGGAAPKFTHTEGTFGPEDKLGDVLIPEISTVHVGQGCPEMFTPQQGNNGNDGFSPDNSRFRKEQRPNPTPEAKNPLKFVEERPSSSKYMETQTPSSSNNLFQQNVNEPAPGNNRVYPDNLVKGQRPARPSPSSTTPPCPSLSASSTSSSTPISSAETKPEISEEQEPGNRRIYPDNLVRPSPSSSSTSSCTSSRTPSPSPTVYDDNWEMYHPEAGEHEDYHADAGEVEHGTRYRGKRPEARKDNPARCGPSRNRLCTGHPDKYRKLGDNELHRNLEDEPQEDERPSNRRIFPKKFKKGDVLKREERFQRTEDDMEDYVEEDIEYYEEDNRDPRPDFSIYREAKGEERVIPEIMTPKAGAELRKNSGDRYQHPRPDFSKYRETSGSAERVFPHASDCTRERRPIKKAPVRPDPSAYRTPNREYTN